MFPNQNPKMGAMSRALATAQPAPTSAPLPPDPTPSGDTQDPAGAAHPDDVQIITEAAASDPVIAAIARVLGIG